MTGATDFDLEINHTLASLAVAESVIREEPIERLPTLAGVLCLARAQIESMRQMHNFFLDQIQIQSAKMDGKHHYRFCGGWPMTHCIGSTKDEAVKAAMEEVKLSKGEQA